MADQPFEVLELSDEHAIRGEEFERVWQEALRRCPTQRELVDTLVHEELYHCWFKRGIYNVHQHPILDDKFNAVVERYMRLRRVLARDGTPHCH